MSELSVKYPVDITTPEEKTKFLYGLQEVVRQKHNEKGEKYNTGFLSKKQWYDFLEKEFEPRSHIISEEIIIQRKLFKKNIHNDADFSNSFNEKKKL